VLIPLCVHSTYTTQVLVSYTQWAHYIPILNWSCTDRCMLVLRIPSGIHICSPKSFCRICTVPCTLHDTDNRTRSFSYVNGILLYSCGLAVYVCYTARKKSINFAIKIISTFVLYGNLPGVNKTHLASHPYNIKILSTACTFSIGTYCIETCA